MNQAYTSGKYFSKEIAGCYNWSEFQGLLGPRESRPWCATPNFKHVDTQTGITEQELLLCLGGEQEVRKNTFTPFEVAAIVEREKSSLIGDEQGNHFCVLGLQDQMFIISVFLRGDECLVDVHLHAPDTLHLGSHRLFRKVK